MASVQFDEGLEMAFGITGGLLLCYAVIITICGPIAVVTSETYNVWMIWSALPALWLGWLFMWIAHKLTN